jgi:hypothetical protein
MDHAVTVRAEKRKIRGTVHPCPSNVQRHDVVAFDEATPAIPVNLLETEAACLTKQWLPGPDQRRDLPFT